MQDQHVGNQTFDSLFEGNVDGVDLGSTIHVGEAEAETDEESVFQLLGQDTDSSEGARDSADEPFGLDVFMDTEDAIAVVNNAADAADAEALPSGEGEGVDHASNTFNSADAADAAVLLSSDGADNANNTFNLADAADARVLLSSEGEGADNANNTFNSADAADAAVLLSSDNADNGNTTLDSADESFDMDVFMGAGLLGLVIVVVVSQKLIRISDANEDSGEDNGNTTLDSADNSFDMDVFRGVKNPVRDENGEANSQEEAESSSSSASFDTMLQRAVSRAVSEALGGVENAGAEQEEEGSSSPLSSPPPSPDPLVSNSSTLTDIPSLPSPLTRGPYTPPRGDAASNKRKSSMRDPDAPPQKRRAFFTADVKRGDGPGCEQPEINTQLHKHRCNNRNADYPDLHPCAGPTEFPGEPNHGPNFKICDECQWFIAARLTPNNMDPDEFYEDFAGHLLAPCCATCSGNELAVHGDQDLFTCSCKESINLLWLCSHCWHLALNEKVLAADRARERTHFRQLRGGRVREVVQRQARPACHCGRITPVMNTEAQKRKGRKVQWCLVCEGIAVEPETLRRRSSRHLGAKAYNCFHT
ncbi:MAG: hypothetical protein M1829_004705 [Trizodia sp. TS-e1964]|nr:MAG: hypothetical protein M1829_004705 [Trizodia sp. TS-e1964]